MPTLLPTIMRNGDGCVAPVFDGRGFLAIFVAFLAGCSGGTDTEKGEQDALQVTLVRADDISAFQRIEFSTVNDIEWASDTEIALVDVHEGRVVIQDFVTGRERSIGRTGEGPGELQWPVRHHAEAGVLLVADSRNQRLTLYDLTTEEFVAAAHIEGMPLEILGFADSTATVAMIPFLGAAGPAIQSIDFTTDSRRDLFEIFAADGRLRQLSDGGGARMLPTARNSLGHIYAGVGSEYRIVAFDSAGNVVGSVMRQAVTSSMPDTADVQRFRNRIEAATAGIGREVVEQQVQRYAETPVAFFGLTSLVVGPEDRLWVLRTPATDSTALDLFSASGDYEGTLRVRDRVQAVAFRDSLVAVLVERASGNWEGLNSVDVYRVAMRTD